MSYQIFAYDEEVYVSHKAAELSGALYKTENNIDYIKTQNGLHKVLEVYNLFSNASGLRDIVPGIVDGVQFVSLKDISDRIDEDSIDVEPFESDDTYKAINAILKDRENAVFTISVKAILGDDCIILQDEKHGVIQPIDDHVKMNFIKLVGRAIVNDRSLEQKYPDEILIVKNEMALIQAKDFAQTFDFK